MINQLVKFTAHHLRDSGYIWQKGAETDTQRFYPQNFEFEFSTSTLPTLSRLGFPIHPGYCFRDSMPLNSVGKFDRAKLKDEATALMAKLAATAGA